MKQDITLKMALYDKDHFALGKGNMDAADFKKLIESLIKAFKEAYQNNYKEYADIIEQDSELLMLVLQKKTPNVVKAIVEHPKLPGIKIAIYGLDNQGEPKIEVLKSPYNHNLCASLNPYYNGLNEVKKEVQQTAEPKQETKNTQNSISRKM